MKALAALLMICAAPVWAERIDPVDLIGIAASHPADVVVLGEIHDNPAHHANQARAVAALHPKALVFEMFTAEAAAKLPADRSDRGAVETALGWQGWPDFGMYHPIFLAAPTAKIYGAELPRAAAKAVFSDGVAAVFGDEADDYALMQPLDPAEQSAREVEQAEAHCGALPPDLLPGMVLVQRLRDAMLARAVVQALAETGGPVAVITGSGHARKDRGVASVLAQVSPASVVLSIGQLEDDPGPDAPYDLWLVSDPVSRPDPCAELTGG